MQDFVLISIPETTIKNIVEQAVREAFASQAPSTYKEQSIVDLDGLLKARPFIGSKSTIYKKVSAAIIPHSKSGKRLIFDLNEIDEWLLAHKIKTAEELDAEAMAYMNANNKKRRP